MIRRPSNDTILTVAIIVVIISLRLVGFGVHIILTDSMEPEIKPGSIVVTAPTWLIEPKSGDVIVYTVELGGKNYTIMHRVIRAFERNGTTYFVTKGDNREFPDQWIIPSENVKGVYLFSVPHIGKLLVLPAKHYPYYAGIVITISISYISYVIIREATRLKLQEQSSAVKREREVLRVARVKKFVRGYKK